jgi:predicted secreted protein
MAVLEILTGILVVVALVKFRRKTPIYWVLLILAAYGIVKYFTRFEYMTDDAKTKRLAEINKDITYLKSLGLNETSDNATMKRLVAERNNLNPPSPVDQKAKRLAEINKDITYLKSLGLTETSENDTMKRLVAERNSLTAPGVAPNPAPAKVPEKPVPWSLCSIERTSVL